MVNVWESLSLRIGYAQAVLVGVPVYVVVMGQLVLDEMVEYIQINSGACVACVKVATATATCVEFVLSILSCRVPVVLAVMMYLSGLLAF
jgi:hypothetical protein